MKGVQRDCEDLAIENRLVQHFPFRPQSGAERLHNGLGGDGQHETGGHAGADDEGEVPPCPGQVSLAHGPGYHGAAAGTRHEAHCAEDHQGGHDKVHRRDSGFPREVGDEDAIHHAADGSEDQHNDGGEGEAEQLSIGEVLG